MISNRRLDTREKEDFWEKYTELAPLTETDILKIKRSDELRARVSLDARNVADKLGSSGIAARRLLGAGRHRAQLDLKRVFLCHFSFSNLP